MKMIFVLALLGFANGAHADLSIECYQESGVIALDLAKDWYLTDESEPSLSHAKVTPIQETDDKVSFLHDYGSDSDRHLYEFVGLTKCGVYGNDVEVVTLTKSMRTFDGKTQKIFSNTCTCVED